MSRSVSTHVNAVATVYLNPELESSDDFDFFLEDLRDNVLPKILPSPSKANRWSGREDHVIADGAHYEVSVSEYNGLVAICLAPLDVDNEEDVEWCGANADDFRDKLNKVFRSCALNRMGTASNGEAFFTLKSTPGSVVTSKEGRLPMFA